MVHLLKLACNISLHTELKITGKKSLFSMDYEKKFCYFLPVKVFPTTQRMAQPLNP